MPYEPQKHHRRSIRLKGYDYTQAGAYFVTLCIRNRDCLLGEIMQGIMHLSPFGRIVEKEWYRTATVRRNVELDAFVIMPNHIHGIIILSDTNRNPLRATRRYLPVCSPDFIERVAPTDHLLTPLRATRRYLPAFSPDFIERVAPTAGIMDKPLPKGPLSASLGAIVGQFKSLSAKRINRLRQTPSVPVWQRDFYDHIIHREASLHAIQRYIVENPLHWTDDTENPEYPIPDQHPLTDFPF
jgi:REP element-mobilizing transposase RayT